MSRQPIYINSIASVHPSLEEKVEWVPGKQLKVIEPDYKELIPDAGIRRRMSRLVRMGVASGMQCLQQVSDIKPDAILTATGLGCLADTEKFMNTILDNEEELLTPTAFILSTFNTVGAQIALLTGNHCYNNTFVHRAFSLESALLDAILMIREGDASNALVGAMDELTPTLYAILERFGCWRKAMPGEGAAFFLLSDQQTSDSYAVLEDIEIFSGKYRDDQIDLHIREFLERNNAEDATILYPDDFKKYCGEYPTAMSFALWYMCKQIKEQKSLPGSGKPSTPVLLYNSFLDNHSFILLKPV